MRSGAIHLSSDRCTRSPRPPPARGASLRSPGLTLLFIGESLVLLANGIAFTAIAAGAVSAGLDSTVVGAAGSAFSAELFAVYLAGPIFVTRMGLRTMALVGIALLYVAMENWINLATGRNARGRALAIYMAVYLGSYAAGQAVPLAVPSTSTMALGIAAASLLAGLVTFAFAVPPAVVPSPPRSRGDVWLAGRRMAR